MRDNKKLSCFKTYDVRGELNHEFNSEICYRIGRAFASYLKAKKVVVGWDSRESSSSLAKSVFKGLSMQGCDVLNLGMCGTEEMYSATSEFKACGGIVITASHNPINFNGMKFVKKGSAPIDPETDLLAIKNLAEKETFHSNNKEGCIIEVCKKARESYVKKILNFINYENFLPLKVVFNFGNGTAGPTFDKIVEEIRKKNNNLEIEEIYKNPDSSFPNGIPNPLLEENRSITADAVIKSKADLGVAFDGDFDRCFFFDEKGRFVNGEHIVALLARVFLENEKNARIVYEPRLIWCAEDAIKKYNGFPVKSKTGHVFIKQAMRSSGAVYGGEISAHHYFRDFNCCDSGMLPWLLVVKLMCETKEKISELVNGGIRRFPSSSEKNFFVEKPEIVINKVKSELIGEVVEYDTLDGLSMTFKNWRFNLRPSNTESLLRLNLETKGQPELVAEMLDLIEKIIRDH